MRFRIFDTVNKVYLSNGMGTHVDVEYFINPFNGKVIGHYSNEKGKMFEEVDNVSIEIESDLKINNINLFENDVVEKDNKKYIIKKYFKLKKFKTKPLLNQYKLIGSKNERNINKTIQK